MKKSMINKVVLSGPIYDHKLAEKTVQNTSSANFGKPFINGSLDIVTDDEGLNVVTVHYSYVTPTTKAGNENKTYTALKKIIDSGKTVVTDGMAAATLVQADSSIALNDFITNRDGEETMVSARRIEGGFVTLISKLNPKERNVFEVDILLNGFKYVEADGEKVKTDYAKVNGAVFDYRNKILPLKDNNALIIKDTNGLKYFESLELSPQNVAFTKVWGSIVNEATSVSNSEESAWGESMVKNYTKTIREWVINGSATELYEFGDAETAITADEVKKAMADRELYLADVKKKNDEYLASKQVGGNAVTAAAGANTLSSLGF